MSTHPKQIFRFETLPRMDNAVGHEEAHKLLKEVIKESESEERREP